MSVIGSLLLDSRYLDEITLQPSDFALVINKELYMAMRQLQSEGTAVDPVSVQKRMEQNGTPVDSKDIVEYMQVTPTAVNALMYADMVKAASMTRQLRTICYSTYEETDNASDCRELLSNTIRDLETLQASDDTTDLVDTVTALTDFMEYRKELVKNPESKIVKTGFPQLDKMLGGGVVNGGMYILGARPGMGKTSIATQIAENVAKASGKVLFVSLEMTKEQITAKRLALQTGISTDAILMQTLDETQDKKILAASAQLSRHPLIVNKRPRATVADIQAMAARSKPRLIVIDYLGLVRSAEKRKNRYEEVSQISHDVKGLALRLNVPILCLAQLNRENEQAGDKRPKLNNLRDSGDIEQDADGVMFIYRADYYDRNPQHNSWESTPAEIIIAKNRFGRTGTVNYAWFGNTGRIIEERERRYAN